MTPARCPPLAEWCHLPSPGHHPLDGLSVYPPPAPPFQFVSTAPGGWAGAEHSGWDPCSATPISPQTSYSVLRRLAFRPKTQFTPLPSASRVQQVREGRGGGCHRPGLGEEGTRGGAGGGVGARRVTASSVTGPLVEWPLPSALPRRACSALGKYQEPPRAGIPLSCRLRPSNFEAGGLHSPCFSATLLIHVKGLSVKDPISSSGGWDSNEPSSYPSRASSRGPSPPMWQEQIAVRLFDQESCMRLQEGPGKPPPVSTPCGPHPSRTPSLQEIKMQVSQRG